MGIFKTIDGIIKMDILSKSDGVVGFLGFWGVLAIIVLFMVVRSWIRKKYHQIAQRDRDQRTAQLYDKLNANNPDEQTETFSFYLRPFKSTGRVRIPLRSKMYKRGVLAGPTHGIYDPEIGRTSRYKRYVTFGDFETELAKIVETESPLVALGRTGEQIGAGRLESNDKDWRKSFKLFAQHARVIFLIPSTHDGTKWEIKRILNDSGLLLKTIFFIPPSDTVLGTDVGPHLEIGAGKGHVGELDLKKDAIKAIKKFLSKKQINKIKKDKLGALLRLTQNQKLDSYHSLRMTKSLSLDPFSVGSNLHLDRDHLEQKVNKIIRLIYAQYPSK